MVALMAQKAEVTFDSCHLTPSEIATMVDDMGFGATVMEDQDKRNQEGLLELHVGDILIPTFQYHQLLKDEYIIMPAYNDVVVNASTVHSQPSFCGTI